MTAQVPERDDLAARYIEMAAVALDGHEIIANTDLGVFCVPDSMILEGLANGFPDPVDARAINRSDGRTAYFFDLPAGWTP